MTLFTISNFLFWIAFAATALTVFPFRLFAIRVGIVDHPDSFRKLQQKPVPVGGGVVIFLVMVAVMVGLVYQQESFCFRLGLSPKLLLPLIIVSPFIIVLGLIDDKLGVNGRTKLLFQIIAASVIIGFAKYYSEVMYFGIELNLHHLFYPLAVFWIIGMINAINLLDGADGVAVTVGFYMSLATAGIAYFNGHWGIMLISLGLAGCLLGFFVHNRPPARVYLGDTGSMFIGMMLATLMLRASVASSDRTISICGPFAIVLIPAVDSFFAVIRRVNSGRTIFSPDRGHIHHLLAAKFSSGYTVLLILSLLIIPGCVAAVLGTYYQNDYIPVLTSLGILSIAIITDLFGRRELFILLGRIKGHFRKLFDKQKYQSKNGEIYHIQGKGPWRQIWNRLIPILRNYPCRCLQLDINIPCKHEDFFGEWENVTKKHLFEGKSIICSIPLIVDEKQIGTLRTFFNNQKDKRNELLGLTSKLSEICENSVKQYLDTGIIDESLSVLPFQEQKIVEIGKSKTAA
ncbi:MAG: undecaprenyl/decaprenyl-phosphate alpha-N-acetylglucosaminyl 1-phosphate transferase [Planctomycetaceae bacterium]|jgi:UDP-GlcNAc:undecaprenyl-phosphate GlcNAc-1-phosphate transferase|nr:undecaprenyl/decaprenyl-phosphate alpha-N-acetylglucosaminyl 1-phosphate transferase [Planctomycetaceae bacterium]